MRILLALDNTEAALRAEDAAFAMVRQNNGRITGVAVVDTAELGPAEPTGAQVKAERDAAVAERAPAHSGGTADRLTVRATTTGIDARTILVEDNAADVLVAAAETHDVVVMGRDTHFGRTGHDRVSPLIERLLKTNPRPVIVVPEEARPGARTLIAYDGSVTAMRALQLFCLLHPASRKDAIVVCVNEDLNIAGARCTHALSFMEPFGIRADAHPVESRGSAAEVIASTAQAMEAGLIVMGAYGHHPLRELLLGSTTQKLLALTKSPLFIHH